MNFRFLCHLFVVSLLTFAVNGQNYPPGPARPPPSGNVAPRPGVYAPNPTNRPRPPLPLPVATQPLLPLSAPSNFNPKRPLYGVFPNQTEGLVAQIHGNGVSGYALFTVANGGGTNVQTVLRGGPARESYTMKIYSQPTKLGESCSTTSLGSLIYDITFDYGPILNTRESVFKSPIDMHDEKKGGLLGRTLLIQGIDSGVRICSTILSTQSMAIYEGRFHYPIAGIAYVIDCSHGLAIGTEWMMHSDGQRKDAQYRWALYHASDDAGSLNAKYHHEKTACSHLRSTNLIIDNEQENAPHLPVSTEMPNLRGKSHLVFRPRVSVQASKVIYLVLFEEVGKQILACVPLNRIEKKVVIARFINNEIQGHVKLTQQSPYESTKVEIDLDLRVPAFSYGIDVLPNIIRRKKELKKCPNIRETIYNPYHVDPEEVPNQGEGTTDQYATGDLSGKYGTLAGKKREYIELYDFNLPLFGYFSVVGRAVVIYAPNGPAIRCANLDFENIDMVTAFATFDVPLQGQFIFRQPIDRPHEDAYIYIEISKPNANNVSQSYNHGWHVHNNQVKPAIEMKTLSTSDCDTIGSHFNPYGVSTECIYLRDCTIFTPSRCEIGDLSNKLGPMDIPPYKSLNKGEDSVGKYYFVDSDLPLSGPNTIIGRSAAIHEADFTKPIITCSNIHEFKAPVN